MSLRPIELQKIADELRRELAEAVVQKVSAPTTTRVYLELRIPGRSLTLHLNAERDVARIGVVEERPKNPPTPPTWQHVLRKELTGAKLMEIDVSAERRTAALHFTKDTKPFTLVLEVTAAPSLSLLTQQSRILATSYPAREGLRVGGLYTPLEATPVREQTSRLAGDHVVLRLTHAAEAMFTQQERARWLKHHVAPLEARLKRLERTKEKVRVDADRIPLAEKYREEGELLTHNLHRLQRGQKSVVLTRWADDGAEVPCELTLDPKRTPKEEMEWRFHQYRRLKRGAEMAQARLAQLEAEAEQVRRSIAELVATEDVPIEAVPKKKGDEKLPPYREYTVHGGQHVWVGRGSAHNDELTFHVARPHHIWLHARGVPGAHVVIPLEKSVELSQEVLLDAAHLAAHHSDAKGEPRAEVSYVPAKFVHKQKGAAPGAVTYTREKTFVVRLEPERLARLLASVVG